MPAAHRPRTSKPSLSAEGIKQVAWRQLAEQGSSGLSLRAIGRELGVTAPALYNYFPRLDDLITALVVDAFGESGRWMIDAGNAAAAQSGHAVPAIEAMLLAYRDWAVTWPARFALIYGNPIPGYEAPAEITVPLAARPFLALMERLAEAYAQGEIGIPPEFSPAPPATDALLRAAYPDLAARAPSELACVLFDSWARMHGLVFLELYGHIAPVTGDTAAYYRYEVRLLLQRLVDSRPAAR
jgi:AcrR family transcriptional regulator